MPKKKKQDEAPKKRRWLIWSASIALVALLFFSIWKVRHPRAPDELVGTWTTAAPQYADKYFEIGPAIVSFSFGDGASSTGFIQDIQSAPADAGTLYTISYNVNGEIQEVSFYYASSQIHFKNQKDIAWTKQSTD